MAHFARQNDSFWKVKWAVLKCKMGHSASDKNVKKIQVLCFQRFRKLSNFAYLRPQDFNFRIIDSQSTFFDFLSKHFRTVPPLVVSWNRPYPTPATALSISVPVALLRPHENKPISLISKYSVCYFSCWRWLDELVLSVASARLSLSSGEGTGAGPDAAYLQIVPLYHFF